ncbi:MAG: hypothetical protein IPK96_09820 [Flammeovirgaceae bacterium]|nr:hypothetical protein [Flammeovirgaceae bacterium]
MQKYARVSFLYFFLAACIGLLLRWHFVSPMDWLDFPHWLHAHSHLMFLGWVFNFLSLAFIYEHIDVPRQKKFLTLYVIIQFLLAGMTIAFPLQGYGLYSITFSVLHSVTVFVFIIWFFKDGRGHPFDPARWFAKLALIFFLIASVGPFSLGPLMANGLAQTKWYYFSVYYYLHFQYNGVFTFGVLSLFFSFLKINNVTVDVPTVKKFGHLLFFGCFLTYLLSTLWAKPGLVYNGIGLVGAIIQLIALFYFLRLLREIPKSIFVKLSISIKDLLMVAMLSFILKLLLQTASAHPELAQHAYLNRNYIMAYLHLVLLGIITTFLIAWSIEKGWLNPSIQFSVWTFLLGFIGTEWTLLGWIPSFIGLQSSQILLVFSFVMLVGVGGMIVPSLRSTRAQTIS